MGPTHIKKGRDKLFVRWEVRNANVDQMQGTGD